MNLVPGDIVRLRLGDIIPADVRLIEGDYLSVDQSALTGESLPVDKKIGDVAYSSSVAKQGEMVALVTATGANTYFGKTAKLVSTAKSVSHFQKAVLTIGDYLIYLSLGLAAILLLTMLFRGEPVLTLFQFALILVVAAIPVAMPAVLSVTMAIGAVVLARKKAILTRLGIHRGNGRHGHSVFGQNGNTHAEQIDARRTGFVRREGRAGVDSGWRARVEGGRPRRD